MIYACGIKIYKITKSLLFKNSKTPSKNYNQQFDLIHIVLR